MALPRFAVYCLLPIVLSSCGPATHRDPALGEAYVGPATMRLSQEINPKSATVATVHFGQKVEIIGTRRRFVKVRTSVGAEGWLPDNMLLDQAEIDQVKAQSDAARAYPSQGTASTDDTLNVHVQPYRLSPSYIQLKAGERFDVLEHRLVTVPLAAVRKQLLPPAPRIPRKPRKETKAKVPPPPAPAPPALPLDWKELSKEGQDANPPKTEEPAPTTREEDWSLVRTASGQSGWVRTSVLYMAIPDEVAQYAEGHRITSYFKLGTVHDQDRVKDVWLWTTIGSPNHPYDYDVFRVFIWSLRHHRYETALIQRHLIGHFPTLVDPKAGTFSVCIEKDDGHRYRREYQLVQNVVKFAGEKPCEPGPAASSGSAPQQPASEGTFDKLKGKLKSIMK